VIAIAVVAYAGSDAVHELAHALVGRLSGYEVVSISTVATQSAASSRSLAAAGTLANAATGAIAWLFFSRKRLDATRYFLWLFGCVSLMNVGYLMASAVLDSGDWAFVIAGLAPHLAWRVGIGIVGLALYLLVVRRAAALLLQCVGNRQLRARNVGDLTVPAYVAGGLVMVAASLFNPIGLPLVWASGVGASFALTFGLLRIGPIVVKRSGSEQEEVASPVPRHTGWIAAGVGAAVLFVGVLGPGIRF